MVYINSAGPLLASKELRMCGAEAGVKRAAGNYPETAPEPVGSPGSRFLEVRVKIRIDKAACVGNARCWAVSEALFPLDDDGYIAVQEVDVPPGMEALARRGARACPERVITIIEDEQE